MKKYVFGMALLALPALAGAQTPDQAFAPAGYATVRSGFTFGTEMAPLVGGEVATRFGSSVFFGYSSFDWHRNIAPQWLGDVMDIIHTVTDVNIGARMPSYTFTGGVKAMAPTGTVRPYGLAGSGFGAVHGVITLDGEDVTDAAIDLGFVNRSDMSATKALFEVGGGVMIPAGKGYVDVGYRFRKFFGTDEGINMSGLYIGGGIGF